MEPIKSIFINHDGLTPKSFIQHNIHSFNIKQQGNYEIRMNEMIQGIQLWLKESISLSGHP